jgi:phage baseplate assembly protein W
MALLSEIKAVYWQPKIGEVGAIVQGLDDIHQCIRIIVQTPRGADPVRPTFGCDAFLYLDTPVNVAVPSINKAVIEALILWEPRISVDKITTSLNGSSLTINIEWSVKESAAKNITRVEL